ncbi:MAG: single-stranded DNA-binding protein [Clostridia bacterium]|nr:single-stranded DNA-binding protein [Clostridia bacterium]
MAFNKVILVGNLTADPELKQTPSGVSVVTFTLAVQRRFAKPDDAQQADFINIVAWRQTAEFISRYFSKGKSILVCGAIQSRSYTDQNGQKRYVTEVVADEVTFVEKKSSDSPRSNDMFYGEPPRQSFGAGAPAATQPDTNFEEVGEDDLPF